MIIKFKKLTKPGALVLCILGLVSYAQAQTVSPLSGNDVAMQPTLNLCASPSFINDYPCPFGMPCSAESHCTKESIRWYGVKDMAEIMKPEPNDRPLYFWCLPTWLNACVSDYPANISPHIAWALDQHDIVRNKMGGKGYTP